MTDERIQQELQEQVAEKIRLAAEGPNRFRVFTPFVFDDGDHLAVVLRKEDAGWALSDEGHTYMHLALDIDEPDPHRGEAAANRRGCAVGVRDRGSRRRADPDRPGFALGGRAVLLRPGVAPDRRGVVRVHGTGEVVTRALSGLHPRADACLTDTGGPAEEGTPGRRADSGGRGGQGGDEPKAPGTIREGARPQHHEDAGNDPETVTVRAGTARDRSGNRYTRRDNRENPRDDQNAGREVAGGRGTSSGNQNRRARRRTYR